MHIAGRQRQDFALGAERMSGIIVLGGELRHLAASERAAALALRRMMAGRIAEADGAHLLLWPACTTWAGGLAIAYGHSANPEGHHRLLSVRGQACNVPEMGVEARARMLQAMCRALAERHGCCRTEVLDLSAEDARCYPGWRLLPEPGMGAQIFRARLEHDLHPLIRLGELQRFIRRWDFERHPDERDGIGPLQRGQRKIGSRAREHHDAQLDCMRECEARELAGQWRQDAPSGEGRAVPLYAFRSAMMPEGGSPIGRAIQQLRAEIMAQGGLAHLRRERARALARIPRQHRQPQGKRRSKPANHYVTRTWLRCWIVNLLKGFASLRGIRQSFLEQEHWELDWHEDAMAQGLDPRYLYVVNFPFDDIFGVLWWATAQWLRGVNILLVSNKKTRDGNRWLQDWAGRYLRLPIQDAGWPDYSKIGPEDLSLRSSAPFNTEVLMLGQAALADWLHEQA